MQEERLVIRALFLCWAGDKPGGENSKRKTSFFENLVV